MIKAKQKKKTEENYTCNYKSLHFAKGDILFTFLRKTVDNHL